MQADALQLRMRTRSAWEAADLGIRFAQRHWRELHACHAVVTVPVVALCVASHELAPWLPLVLLFLAKPWIDRTSLFVLSRAAFGLRTSPGDLWREQRRVLWGQLFITFTLRRLSFSRSFTQPVYQLEGRQITRRRRLLERRYRAPAVTLTALFSLVESLLAIAIVSLALWLAPSERGNEALWARILDFPHFAAVFLPVIFGVVILFLEPFYVAAGFGMYLNRRTELEAWDLEQELRHAFAH